MTMTMDLFQLRAQEGQKIRGEILHTMVGHKIEIQEYTVQTQKTILLNVITQ